MNANISTSNNIFFLLTMLVAGWHVLCTDWGILQTNTIVITYDIRRCNICAYYILRAGLSHGWFYIVYLYRSLNFADVCPSCPQASHNCRTPIGPPSSPWPKRMLRWRCHQRCPPGSLSPSAVFLIKENYSVIINPLIQLKCFLFFHYHVMIGAICCLIFGV